MVDPSSSAATKTVPVDALNPDAGNLLLEAYTWDGSGSSTCVPFAISLPESRVPAGGAKYRLFVEDIATRGSIDYALRVL